MLRLLFGGKPGWIDQVEKNGLPAKAVVVSDPADILKGKGYEGEDRWVEFAGRVEPENDTAYEAKIQCKLSQAVFGLMKPGTRVNVKVDPKDKTRVLLTDDVNTLQSYRLVK